MKYDLELQIAIEAVKKACVLCSKVQSSLVSEETITKKDKSPVTVADFGAQTIICHELSKSISQTIKSLLKKIPKNYRLNRER